MRITLVSFLHFIIWSGFSIVLLLSDRDKLHYKVLLFFVFFYLAYIIANIMLHSRKEAFFFTVVNSVLFFMSKLLFFTG
ncbi:hypothetical protein CN326_01860 [Bacillus sp. AFS018417]|uniref:Group-specific protein n=1 Tax=Bacillus rhizoplanae TaxID=2880966 RepID=A0ABM8Y5Q0_9BACI|nr:MULTISPECIES: hypothetical protein [Bacillus]PEZ10298.1 hypothetical protein CN326_01860 [Bacillus sp. AFS018417]CAG9611026.1 hypothetical protein BACCIP111899_00198 [Bacillus rhizoplanae]